jgi:hypothetical protein
MLSPSVACSMKETRSDAGCTFSKRLSIDFDGIPPLNPAHGSAPLHRKTNFQTILPSVAFASLRDGESSADVTVEARRAHYESNIFQPLEAAGVSSKAHPLRYLAIIIRTVFLMGVSFPSRCQAQSLAACMGLYHGKQAQADEQASLHAGRCL